jgi:cytochrome P450 PksS
MRELGPVIPITRPIFGRTYLLTRYDGVHTCLKDPRFVNNRRNAVAGSDDILDRWFIPRMLKVLGKNMIVHDDPEHRRLRNLVHKAFTPRMIESLSAQIEQMVDQMLDQAVKKPVADLMADLAVPLPLTVICEMLGVPETERKGARHLMSKFVHQLTNLNLGSIIRGYPTSLRMDRFFRDLVKLRREQPGDDLTSALVNAEEAGDRLNQEELISMLFVLLLAGHETTVNLIGNGMLALLDNPDQLQKLREHPELMESAIEELLRYGNPVSLPAPRFTREDVDIQGFTIPKGSMVLPVLASANRDEAAFQNADRLDIARSPNRHVAFGYGIHYCLGAPLARLEGRIAFQKLLQRFPEIRLAVPREKLSWRRNINLHGLNALPLHLSSQAASAGVSAAA